MMDIDHFKKVNDTLGHVFGDEVLKAVSAEIVNQVRETDYVGRYGGEEFLILLPNSDIETSRPIAERIRQSVEAIELDDVKITISGGIAISSEEMDNLLKLADKKTL